MSEEGRLILGLQPVREALRAHGSNVLRVLVQRSESPKLDALARFANDQNVTVERVPRAALDKLAGGGRHQGVAALAPPLSFISLEDISVGAANIIIGLDNITDPQNFGATIRSAVALGDGTILWGEHHAAPLTPSTFRASAGAVERATLCRVNSLRVAVSDLAARGVTTVALDAGATTSLTQVDLTGPALLVVGAEDRGVSRGVRNACQLRARLDMAPDFDSLNTSVAAAVALYEVRRQRMASTS